MNFRRLFNLDEIPTTEKIPLRIDGEPCEAARHETVLAVLLAQGRKAIYKTDHGQLYGAFCGMGVCYGCSVRIDGVGRQRSCQVLVRPGMEVETCATVSEDLIVQDAPRRNEDDLEKGSSP